MIQEPLSPTRAVAYGALTVGVLDGLDAVVFFGLRGVSPVRIFQGIASGFLGRAAFDGGAATAALGVLTHFFIALAIVATYYAASRRIAALVERPYLWGPLYGVAVYLFMNLVVVPLSAARSGPVPPAVLVNGLLIHIVGVGLPSAVVSRAARTERA